MDIFPFKLFFTVEFADLVVHILVAEQHFELESIGVKHDMLGLFPQFLALNVWVVLVMGNLHPNFIFEVVPSQISEAFLVLSVTLPFVFKNLLHLSVPLGVLNKFILLLPDLLW